MKTQSLGPMNSSFGTGETNALGKIWLVTTHFFLLGMFTPKNLGKMIANFDGCIFFKGVGEKPPNREDVLFFVGVSRIPKFCFS